MKGVPVETVWNLIPVTARAQILVSAFEGSSTICAEDRKAHTLFRERVLNLAKIIPSGHRGAALKDMEKNSPSELATYIITRMDTISTAHRRDLRKLVAEVMDNVIREYYLSPLHCNALLCDFLDFSKVRHIQGCVTSMDYLRNLTEAHLHQAADHLLQSHSPSDILAMFSFLSMLAKRDMFDSICARLQGEPSVVTPQPSTPPAQEPPPPAEAPTHPEDFDLLDTLVLREIQAACNGFHSTIPMSSLDSLVEQFIKLTPGPHFDYRFFHRGHLHGMKGKAVSLVEADLNERRELWYLVGYLCALVQKRDYDRLVALCTVDFARMMHKIAQLEGSRVVDALRRDVLKQLLERDEGVQHILPLINSSSITDESFMVLVDESIKTALLIHDHQRARRLLDRTRSAYGEAGLTVPSRMRYQHARCLQIEKSFEAAIRELQGLLADGESAFRYVYETDCCLCRLAIPDVTELSLWLKLGTEHFYHNLERLTPEIQTLRRLMEENPAATNAAIVVGLFTLKNGGVDEREFVKNCFNKIMTNIEELYGMEYRKLRLFPKLCFVAALAEAESLMPNPELVRNRLLRALREAGEDPLAHRSLWSRLIGSVEKSADTAFLAQIFDDIAESHLRSRVAILEEFPLEMRESRTERLKAEVDDLSLLPASQEKMQRLAHFVALHCGRHLRLAQRALDAMHDTLLDQTDAARHTGAASTYLEFAQSLHGERKNLLFGGHDAYLFAICQAHQLFADETSPRFHSFVADLILDATDGAPPDRIQELRELWSETLGETQLAEFEREAQLHGAPLDEEEGCSLSQRIRQALARERDLTVRVLFCGGTPRIRRVVEQAATILKNSYGGRIEIAECIPCYGDDNSSRFEALRRARDSHQFDDCQVWMIHRQSKHALTEGLPEAARQRGIVYWRLTAHGQSTIAAAIESACWEFLKRRLPEAEAA